MSTSAAALDSRCPAADARVPICEALVSDGRSEDAYPSQPMVSQVRALLDTYAGYGGSWREVVFADCGHSPHLESPDRFAALVLDHVGGS